MGGSNCCCIPSFCRGAKGRWSLSRSSSSQSSMWQDTRAWHWQWKSPLATSVILKCNKLMCFIVNIIFKTHIFKPIHHIIFQNCKLKKSDFLFGGPQNNLKGFWGPPTEKVWETLILYNIWKNSYSFFQHFPGKCYKY